MRLFFFLEYSDSEFYLLSNLVTNYSAVFDILRNYNEHEHKIVFSVSVLRKKLNKKTEIGFIFLTIFNVQQSMQSI